MTTAKLSEISHHLPPSLREALILAAATTVTPKTPMARIKAINLATDWARATAPELFHAKDHCLAEGPENGVY